MKPLKAILLLLACALTATAATLYGAVIDPDGAPVGEAFISLYSVPEADRVGMDDETMPADIDVLSDSPWLFTDEPVYQAVTGDKGRYRLEGIEPGLYDVSCLSNFHEEAYELDVFLADEEVRQLDFVLGWMIPVDKPNIYLYPTETTAVTVKLGFPRGGGPTVSDPPLTDNAWYVQADPDGTIHDVEMLHWDTLDGYGYTERPVPEPVCEFLFYEAETPDVWQRERGWTVAREDLETFFRENLAATGFYDNEIEDFVEWWIPRLDSHPYYALYPQYNDAIAEVVVLRVDPGPHSLIRLFYVVEGLESSVELPPALIPAFEAGGFTVHEWGVALDGALR